ncbi:adenosine 3'-phospho 5'-phosphosulfate transporter 2 isoform X2 [Palaemon carinicauda]
MKENRSTVIIVGDQNEPKKKSIKLFNVPVNAVPSTPQFLVLSSLVFVFYLIYGYVLELIFTLEGMRPHGWYLTLVQFAYYAAFAAIQIFASGENISKKIPLKVYIAIAILTVGTMGFSNSSVGYLNYPTQVIFKSCKLIPVMIGSIIILGKSYNFLEVLACLCMCIGLTWFTLADSTVQPTFSLTGVMLVSMALLCDAIIGNVQEGAMKKYNEGTTHVVFYSYSIGFVIIFIGLLLSDQLISAISFAAMNPWEVYGRGVMLSAAGFCGVQVVLTFVTLYGALVAVTVTTFRKALTICLSFMVFSKPFTIHYIWGGILVVFGIYLNIYAKKKFGSLSLVVSVQQLYLRVQRMFAPKIIAPKISSIKDSDKILLEV